MTLLEILIVKIYLSETLMNKQKNIIDLDFYLFFVKDENQ